MSPPSTIADYAAALSRELAFDISLSRRVRREVEDHLWEAAAAESGDSPAEAQRHAIARFGDPREIAAQYAAASLFRQTRKMSAIAILVVAAIFLTMKGRLVWFGFMQWGMSDEIRAITELALPIFRWAYVATAGLGIVAWGYIASRQTPARLRSLERRQLKRAQLLCAAVGAAVVVLVGATAVLFACRMSAAPSSSAALVPVGLEAIELVLAGVLVAEIYSTMRRTILAASLQHG